MPPRFQPGHVHAANILAPALDELDQLLEIDAEPPTSISQNPLPIELWPRFWLARLGQGIARFSQGLERFGTLAEDEPKPEAPRLKAALNEVRAALRALMTLHEEAALFAPPGSESWQGELVAASHDALAQIRDFLDEYIDTVQHPERQHGTSLTLTLTLSPPDELIALTSNLPPASTPCRAGPSNGDIWLAGGVGLLLGLYLGGD